MRILTCFSILTVCLCLPALAQQQAHVIAANFDANGKILELDIPSDMDGVRCVVAFETADSRQRVAYLLARAGRHAYEMRGFPEWQGAIKYVAVLLTGVQGRLKEPTLLDELDIFAQPEAITPSTINVLTEHTFYGWSWSDALILISLLATAVIASFTKKGLALSLCLGFVVAWGLMDLRMIFDHAGVIRSKEQFQLGMPPLTEVRVFADRAAEIIGDMPWGHGELEVGTAFLRYRLAEHPYLSSGTSGSPAFWVAQGPSQGQVLFQHDKYVLGKSQR